MTENAAIGEVMKRLDKAFPGRELIGKNEAAAWMGISKRTMVRKYSLPPGNLVSKIALAREMTR